MTEYNAKIIKLINKAGLKPGCLSAEVSQALGRELTGKEIYEIEYIRCVIMAGDTESDSEESYSSLSRSKSPKRSSDDKYDKMKYDKTECGMTETRNGKYTIVCYFQNGKLHRKRNAAKIISKNGKLCKQYYYVGGKLHRSGGPCVIDHINGMEEYWQDGVFIRKASR